MARKKRTKIQFDKESVNNLLQEIYDDTHNIRAKITRLFNKWEKFVEEGGEIAAFGDAIVKLINAEAKNQDQKIMLLKYLKEVVFTEEGNATNQGGNSTISDNDKNALIDMVEDEVVKRNK